MNESSPVPESNPPTTAKKNQSAFWIVLIALAAAGGIYWFVTSGEAPSQTDESADAVADTDAVVEPLDLAALPDVVARVDGVEITREEYVTSITAAEQTVLQQGGDPTEASLQAFVQQQALDQVINNAVLLKAATEAEVSVTSEQIEAEYERIATQFPDPDAFAAELELAGLTSEQLRVNIEKGLTIDQYLQQSDAIANLPEVTDADAQAFYDDLVAQGTEGLPSFADVVDQIKAQIQSQNQQLAVSDLIQSLREAATIEILLPETVETE